MNTLRRFIDPLDVLSRRRQIATPPRHRAATAWWSRLLAARPKRGGPAPVPALTLVLWSSSVEGIADAHATENVN